MGWSPQEELYAAIHKPSGGTIRRPRELLHKARTSAPSYESLNVDELELMMLGFQPFVPQQQTLESEWRPGAWLSFPGIQEARNLVLAQEGVDAANEGLFKSVLSHCLNDPGVRQERIARFEAAERDGVTGLLVQEDVPLGCRPFDYNQKLREMEAKMMEEHYSYGRPSAPSGSRPPRAQEAPCSPLTPPPMPTYSIWTPGELSPRAPTRDDVDHHGRPAWPRLPGRYLDYPAPPRVLYQIEQGGKNRGVNFRLEAMREIKSRYNNLTAEEKADYETRSERLRQEAWDEFEQQQDEQKKRQEEGQTRPSTPPAKRARLEPYSESSSSSSSSPVLPEVVPIDSIRDPGESSPRSPTRHDMDTLGRPAWPWLPGKFLVYVPSPWALYKAEHKDDHWDESLGWLGVQKQLTRRFNGLAAEEKADYEARSERLRQEAWDTYEQRKRDDKKLFEP